MIVWFLWESDRLCIINARGSVMNILILCTYESTYVLQLYKYMKKYYPDIRYSLFTSESSEQYYRENGKIR